LVGVHPGPDLAVIRETGDRYLEADPLIRVGGIHDIGDDRKGARDTWRQALSILEQPRQPGADEVRASLKPVSGSAVGSPDGLALAGRGVTGAP
jgi:hypothetical protein